MKDVITCSLFHFDKFSIRISAIRDLTTVVKFSVVAVTQWLEEPFETEPKKRQSTLRNTKSQTLIHEDLI